MLLFLEPTQMLELFVVLVLIRFSLSYQMSSVFVTLTFQFLYILILRPNWMISLQDFFYCQTFHFVGGFVLSRLNCHVLRCQMFSYSEVLVHCHFRSLTYMFQFIAVLRSQAFKLSTLLALRRFGSQTFSSQTPQLSIRSISLSQTFSFLGVFISECVRSSMISFEDFLALDAFVLALYWFRMYQDVLTVQLSDWFIVRSASSRSFRQ